MLRFLDQVLIGHGCNQDWLVVASGHKVRWLGLGGLSLQANPFAVLLCLLSLLLVLLDALQKVIPALAVPDMLDSDVDSLLHQSIPHLLVDNDAKGTRGDVEDDTGAAVVEFVGHAALLGRVGNNVDKLANLVRGHVGRQLDGAMVPECLSEEMAGASTVTKGGWHNKGAKMRGRDDGWKTLTGHPC